MMRGEFEITLLQQGQPVVTYSVPNTNQIEGIRHLINYIFKKTDTTVRTWYVGLISARSYTTITVDDTGASHTGWYEYTGYWVNGIHGPRAPINIPVQQANPGFGTGPTVSIRDFAITTSTSKPIQFNAPGTLIRGVFVTSARSHNVAGVLVGTAIFSVGGEPLFNHGDEMMFQYRWRWDTEIGVWSEASIGP